MNPLQLTLQSIPAQAELILQSYKLHTELDRSQSILRLFTEDPETELRPLVEQLEADGFVFAHERERFGIAGMTCVNCAASAASMLRFLPGVLSAEVSYANASVELAYLPDLVQAAQMRDVLADIGYQLLIEQGEDAAAKEAALREAEIRKMSRNARWAMILAFPLFVVGMFWMDLPGRDWIMWLLATPMIFIFGRRFFISAYRQLRHRRANMDTLVALSTGIAYAASLVYMLVARMEGRMASAHQLYFEASGVVIAFILMGRYWEEKAKLATSAAIRKMMSLQPNVVQRVGVDGSLSEVPLVSVYPGDLLQARPGDRIAVDGILVSGHSSVDESLITGESMPVEKAAGDQVISGTVNTAGTFVYRAQKVGKDTLLARMIHAVQSAQASRAPVEQLTDKIAAVFVPVVVVIALLSFCVWGLWIGSWEMGFHAAVTVLVISCPCALGLATPTAIVAAMGRGAELGILIRDAVQLERLKDIQVLLVDKTGTLTKGQPELVSVWRHPGLTEADWDTLAAIERRSEHPLAAAVCRYLGERTEIPLQDFLSVPGAGAYARQGDRLFYVGSAAWLKGQGIIPDTESREALNIQSASAYSQVWFGADGRVLAVLQIADELKEGSAAAVAAIQEKGIEVCMLTGDHQAVADSVAAAAGIHQVKAQVSPAQKADFVRELKKSGKVVAMAGDGVNDSEALAAADVSIAMDKGSDVAMELASLTLVQSDLRRIPVAMELSRRTFRIVRQNLFWAFIYNLVGIPLAAGVFYPIFGKMLDPMYAGMAMAFSSVSVVLNSLRLRYGKY